MRNILFHHTRPHLCVVEHCDYETSKQQFTRHKLINKVPYKL